MRIIYYTWSFQTYFRVDFFIISTNIFEKASLRGKILPFLKKLFFFASWFEAMCPWTKKSWYFLAKIKIVIHCFLGSEKGFAS